MVHKKATAMAAATVAALALAGCSAAYKDTQSSSASGGDAAVTIRYTGFTANGGNEENLQKIIDAFEEENPGITVDVTVLPYADYFTALQTELASGKPADVFEIEQAKYAGYQESGVLAALDSADTSGLRESLVEAYSTDGTSYALPISFSDVVLFYNKDLFDAAGLDYPTADWTWADEAKAAEALTQAEDGIWGDYQPISYHEFYKTVSQAGGTFLSEDGKSAAFNSPEGLAAAEWLVGKSGTTMPTPEQGAGTPDFDSQLFASGKLGMWHTGIWNFGVMEGSDQAWDIRVEPGDKVEASAVFSNAVAVSAESDAQEAATKLAEYLAAGPVTVQTRLEAGWELPPISDESLLAPYLDAGDPANRQAVFDALKIIAPAPSIGANQAKMEDLVTEELTEAAAGRKSVADALESMESRVNELLK